MAGGGGEAGLCISTVWISLAWGQGKASGLASSLTSTTGLTQVSLDGTEDPPEGS